MVLGIGSGSTIVYAVQRIGNKHDVLLYTYLTLLSASGSRCNMEKIATCR